ncbi:ATP-binding protein [Pectobacterium carotovorum]|uniref:sensor histidine kinase n=1 Tax=Pectobacterium carotovorum TaxID=554 RepID=UPI00301B1016
MQEYNQIISDAMHELRYFNQRLKNLIEQISKKLSADKIGKNEPINLHYQAADELRLLTEGILEISMLFTSRLDFIDCELNPEAINQLPISEFSMYGKFDKARRVLNAVSREKKVKVKINHDSNFKFKARVIKARSIIDILPYLILDNSIKYSPSEGEVNINYIEYPESANITIESIGPFIHKDEIDHITKKGYRSKNAIKLKNITGKGLGLYFAKYICDINNIKINIKSDSLNYHSDNVEMGKFNVELSFDV